MEKNERKPIFTIIDQMIDPSDPLRAEYLLGYHRGIDAQVLGVSDESDEHCMLMDHPGGSGDPYIDSYARGYRDGFEGFPPAHYPLQVPDRSTSPLSSSSMIRTCRGPRE